MNTKLSTLLGLCLIGLSNVSFAQNGATMDDKGQGSMSMQKMDKDHMDQGAMNNGAMKPAAKSKAAMDNGMMKSDATTKRKTKTTTDNGMMSDTKQADQMDQGSMSKTH